MASRQHASSVAQVWTIRYEQCKNLIKWNYYLIMMNTTASKVTEACSKCYFGDKFVLGQNR
jgi:hypothetical protein